MDENEVHQRRSESNHRSQMNDENSRLIESNYDSREHRRDQHWWETDGRSVVLLLFLYVLQGVPLGLAGSIPMVLAGKGVDYQQQALFSFVFWPFSVKLLWAPIVDGAYIKSFGRRKSWLVPSQYAIALVMLLLSYSLDSVLSEKEPNMWFLTCSFFLLNFCAATQDIAVDGWALTMLSKKNVGLASTCNSVGQTAGYFLGYVLYLALESKEFCNNYLRFTPAETGLINMAGFMYFWGIVFFITTTLIMLFKHESPESENHSEDEEIHGVWGTYKQLLQIITLPNVFQYSLILLTCKIGFASESVLGLKLIEAGVHKESLAVMAVPLIPLQILLPFLIAKYTGPKPLLVFLKVFPIRLIFAIIFALVVYVTPYYKQADGTFSYLYFASILFIYALHQVTLYSMFVSQMSFNAKVSDPRIGGTYMTMLNTVANLGGNWPSTLALWMVSPLTWDNCVGGTSDVTYCTKATKETCTSAGGTCIISTDGYYIEVLIFFALGWLWLLWKSKTLKKLQFSGPEQWKINS